MSAMSRQTSFWLRDALEVELRARGTNISDLVHRDLGRLYTLYRRALAEVPLTVNEACLIVDVLNGALMDANSARLLWAEVEDGISLNGLAEKWNVDGPALVKRLQALTSVQALAIVDAAERVWQVFTKDPASSTEEVVTKLFNIRQEATGTATVLQREG
jgi:hypothetical protein